MYINNVGSTFTNYLLHTIVNIAHNRRAIVALANEISLKIFKHFVHILLY